MFLQAPIPGIVLSYRLSRSLRGWSPAHHGLSASASDGSLSHPQPQEQPQQPQQQPLPDSEYGAIAKFAGSQVRRTSTRSATPDLVLVRRSGGALVSIDREFVTSAKKFTNFNEFSEIKKNRKNSYKNSLNARVGVAFQWNSLLI